MADTYERHQAVVDSYENYVYYNITPRIGEIIFVTEREGEQINMFYQGNGNVAGEPLKANAVQIKNKKVNFTGIDNGILIYQSSVDAFTMIDRHNITETLTMNDNDISFQNGGLIKIDDQNIEIYTGTLGKVKLKSETEVSGVLKSNGVHSLGDIYINGKKVLTDRQPLIALQQSITTAKDDEARAAIQNIINTLIAHGLIEEPQII